MNDVVVIKNESFITDHELRNIIYIYFSSINDENEKKNRRLFLLSSQKTKQIDARRPLLTSPPTPTPKL